MGKRGPKPKPTALRVFEGDPGRLLNKREGEPLPPDGECPPAPPWLGSIGRDVWADLAPKLHAIRLLTVVDQRHLAQYCSAWEQWHKADKEVDKHGLTQVNDKGMLVANPAVKQRADARQAIRQLGGDFGLSPASRVGLKSSTPTKSSPLSEFKRKG